MLESRSQMKHVACSTAQHILEKEKEYIIQTSLVGGGGGTCTHTGHPPPAARSCIEKKFKMYVQLYYSFVSEEGIYTVRPSALILTRTREKSLKKVRWSRRPETHPLQTIIGLHRSQKVSRFKYLKGIQKKTSNVIL